MKISTRKIKAIVLALATLAVGIPSIASAANPETVKLTVHYQRVEADYASWNLWLWKNMATGADVDVSKTGVQFTGDDAYGKIATVELTGMDKFDNLGIIVRKGEWLSKDVPDDRFITKFGADGVTEIWLRQNDPTIYYALPTTAAPTAPDNKLAKLYDSPEFTAKYTYTGNDLGNTYSAASTKFRVWAPTAFAVTLVTYEKADSPLSSAVETRMKSDVNGTWTATLTGDQEGLIYNYRVTLEGPTNEAVDPYARATTVNGTRGVVVNLAKTNPAGWNKSKPKFSGKATDAVIYELHVRDLSMDSSSGISTANKGKFLAFTELNTKSGGVLTGVSAIKDLGVTHVELLPIYDFQSVDETAPTFNWGYDPQNYNVPEGSYSSDPTKPTARITELKRAIQSMHSLGLRVNMDVVYNHVYNSSTFSQNLITPGYFFRTDESGTLTNGSGCGNDVATERPMVRKFIVDSVKYWATEYNLDGFRFDLMGLMDIKTINEVTAALKVIDPTIIVIGEGWEMGTLAKDLRASQTNISKLNNVAHFNDQIRDGLKGSVFKASDTGWATGKLSAVGDIKPGIVGNTTYDPMFLNAWNTTSPTQSVNYVESHDNLTLADKLKASVKGISPSGIAQLSQFATSVAFLSQGVPFMQAGQEFLRSKNGDDNSYKSDDATNSLKWSTKLKYSSTVNYYKGLIALRAAHPAFRMTSTADMKANIKFLKGTDTLIAYSINGKAVGDKAKMIVVIHNADTAGATFTLPNSGSWNILAKGSQIGTKTLQVLKSGKVVVPAQSTMVLKQ
jgi:type I pullulanase